MLLLTEATQTDLSASVRESAVAVYRNIAPVSTPVRGTTLPAAVLITALGTAGFVGNTDMGVETKLGRGRAVVGLGWQPINGSEKRHGVTRGKPPREHRKGLQKPSRNSRGRESRNRDRGLFVWLERQVAALQ
ncbi:hypothetical protein [Glycomyces harbinensis]|uniref:Uncharacterized protein n=1 Tax=Glycomyces harbinensis TaxID=58114 RepID=A0A1G7AZ88_9ACTN|nr:hypothetical protein [Glycomyces harbinensis]SDE19970.1 hypothetical protein SAMN05216270_11524 [Glycomyces harbinensis]